MNNFQKTVYGLIIVLFSSIIIGSIFFLPDYETVKLKDLELTTDSIQPEYKVGDTITFNAYLTNDNPYKVKVTLPEFLTHCQAFVPNFGVAVGMKQIENGNQPIIIEPYTDYYLATFSYHQRRVGKFEIQIGCERLEKHIYFNVTDSPTGVSIPSGVSLFLDSSTDVNNPTIMINARNDNPYPVNLPVFYELIHYDSLNNRTRSIVHIPWMISSWAIPENSTITLYDTNVKASETGTPVYFTLYDKTLRYPSDILAVNELTTGILYHRTQTTGSFTYYNRTYSGERDFLTLITDDEELILASNEGYIYNVPFCGTGQPIAECCFNETVIVKGIKTSLRDSSNSKLSVFMIMDVISHEKMWIDNDTLVSETILGAFDFKEIIESGRKEYVAVSPTDIELVNVTIILGEIIRGEDAEMLEGSEYRGPMTPFVRYFTVKRIRADPLYRVIGERRGWIDMFGRCYVYFGWDNL